MSLVYHERPGVYSSYDASSIIARGSTERVIALIGKAEAKAGLYRLHSYAEAKEAFAEGSELGRMAKLAYQNGAGTVLASPVAEDTLEAYQAALALVFAEKEAGFCVVGSALETVQKALRDAVESASKQNGECVGIVGLAEPTLKNLTDRAAVLNSERMVLVAPDVYVWGESTLAGGQMAAAAVVRRKAAGEDAPGFQIGNRQRYMGFGDPTAGDDIRRPVKAGVVVEKQQHRQFILGQAEVSAHRLQAAAIFFFRLAHGIKIAGQLHCVSSKMFIFEPLKVYHWRADMSRISCSILNKNAFPKREDILCYSP